MRRVWAVGLIVVMALGIPALARAQAPASASVSVPRVVTVSGTYQPASGLPAPARATITLTVYTDQTGAASLWQETQDVALDATGRYVVQFGATQPEGLPVAIFAEGQEHWLGVQFAGPGEVERARTRLTSVPYALRAADAETLGGHPASAYVLAPNASGSGSSPSPSSNGSTANASTPPPANVVNIGTPNTLAKYVNTTDVGSSAVTEVNGQVGIGTGTMTPFDLLHVRYTNTTGGLTGFAVQNLGNTNLSYSGMLFYDQNGALGQFQGFNNVTHEYRINNIAKNGASQFDGSINFMIGTTSRFLVTSGGNIGIGTATPNALLDVSNALGSRAIADIDGTTYGTNNFGTEIVGRKARGTQATPTAVQSGDALAIIGGKGFGATNFSTLTSGMTVTAAENWTDTAQGTGLTFLTITSGTTAPTVRMQIGQSGGVGIGTFPPGSGLDVSNANVPSATFGQIFASSYTGSAPAGSLFIGRKARGTSGAPTAALAGDNLVGLVGRGFGTTVFGAGSGIFIRAAENWTDTAQGLSINFNTTPLGSTIAANRMSIDPSGNVGIGTTNPTEALAIVRSGTDAAVSGTSYGGIFGLFGQTARGTSAAPTALQAGDAIAVVGGTGYGATQFGNDLNGGVAIFAAENWTDTARGTGVGFLTTPPGSTAFGPTMALLANGNLALGTPLDVNGIPTATDKLQVFGDIRVGNANTNGCVMNFAGTGLIGTCASDRRYKKGITPFGPALERVAALQPVHFYWRANEFPEHHFGDSQAYGLIAQEVEQVLPELVVTHDDGYKAVDYSKLPLLTIQAVKELKAENDDLKKGVAELKAENDDMKARLDQLEHLIKDMRSTGGAR